MTTDSNNKKVKLPRSLMGGEKGFSLIELLIAMVIFLLVTGTIYGLLEVGRANRDRSSRRSDILKNARVSISLIGRDALNAGLGSIRMGLECLTGSSRRCLAFPLTATPTGTCCPR